MTGRIDIHSHLLPGIDDGCATAEQSTRCARRLVEAGYAHCFVTPHVWVSNPHVHVESIRKWTAELQARLDEASIPLKLHPGGETNLIPDLQHTPAKNIVTHNLAGKYMLIDLWADRLPAFFEPTVRSLQSRGLTIILAHPERMRAVQDEPELADYFAELGLLLQGNLQCFGDAPTAATYRTATRFLREGRYTFLGSDTHKPDTLHVRLAGLEHAIELAGVEVVDGLTIHNPRSLLLEQ